MLDVVFGTSLRFAIAEGAVTITDSTVVVRSASSVLSASAGEAARTAAGASQRARRAWGTKRLRIRRMTGAQADKRSRGRAGGVDQASEAGGPWPGGRGGARASGGRLMAALCGRTSRA